MAWNHGPGLRSLAALTALALLPLACVQTRGTQSATRRQLESYKAEHYAAVPQRAGAPWSWADFETEATRRGFVLVGDVHDDARLHARVLQLVYRCRRVAARAGVAMRLFVEFVGVRDRETLERFLDGGLALTQLAAGIRDRWPSSWLDSRDLDRYFYRSLLETCRELDIRVEPLESIPRLPLERRDAAMARRIREVRDTDPSASLDVVLVGHAHLLGEGHLVDRLGEDARRGLLVLPNVDVRGVAPLPFVELARGMLAWRLRER